MAKGKDSFKLYLQFKALFCNVSDERAGQLIKQIYEYCDDKNPANPKDEIVALSFEVIKASLLKDLEGWKETCKHNSENQKKRWEKQKSQNNGNIQNTSEYERIQPNTNDTDIDKIREDKIRKDIDYSKENSQKENAENSAVNVPEETNNEPTNNSFTKTRMAMFERFWKAYPKKAGKEKCKNWFMAKKRKLSDTLVDQMINTIHKYESTEQWMEDKGRYIPLPYTWLNRGSWEDELEIEQTPPGATEEPSDVDLSFLSIGGNNK